MDFKGPGSNVLWPPVTSRSCPKPLLDGRLTSDFIDFHGFHVFSEAIMILHLFKASVVKRSVALCGIKVLPETFARRKADIRYHRFACFSCVCLLYKSDVAHDSLGGEQGRGGGA